MKTPLSTVLRTLPRRVVFLLVLAVVAGAYLLPFDTAQADDQLTVIMWNVESGGANIQTIAEKCCRFDDADLFGLSEVQDVRWMQSIDAALEEHHGHGYDIVLGTTGRDDRLGVVYDTEELELLATEELHDINPGGRVRAPLVCHFRHIASRQTFLFCVNHLYRSKDELRHEQAQMLNAWAKNQKLPIILGGDMNFDWSIKDNGRSHDRGFDLLMADRVFIWPRPSRIVKTHDSNYNSILDFLFVTPDGPWQVKNSQVVVEDGDFPDTGWTPDHRPVMAMFTFDEKPSTEQPDDAAGEGSEEDQPQAAAPSESPMDALRREIVELESSIGRIKAMVEALKGDDRETVSKRRALLSRLQRMEADVKKLREYVREQQTSAA